MSLDLCLPPSGSRQDFLSLIDCISRHPSFRCGPRWHQVQDWLPVWGWEHDGVVSRRWGCRHRGGAWQLWPIQHCHLQQTGSDRLQRQLHGRGNDAGFEEQVSDDKDERWRKHLLATHRRDKCADLGEGDMRHLHNCPRHKCQSLCLLHMHVHECVAFNRLYVRSKVWLAQNLLTSKHVFLVTLHDAATFFYFTREGARLNNGISFDMVVQYQIHMARLKLRTYSIEFCASAK